MVASQPSVQWCDDWQAAAARDAGGSEGVGGPEVGSHFFHGAEANPILTLDEADQPLEHEHVVRVAAEARPKFIRLVSGIVKEMDV